MVHHLEKRHYSLSAIWALLYMHFQQVLHFRTQTVAAHLIANEITKQFLTDLFIRDSHKVPHSWHLEHPVRNQDFSIRTIKRTRKDPWGQLPTSIDRPPPQVAQPENRKAIAELLASLTVGHFPEGSRNRDLG